ncbi:MAG TPA: lysophospholipid acyltransferase family protein [Acidobacteriaceae bacterium]|jgi:1-acyl-sn-glycerol-3-phosphate acyltransferase
MFASFRLLAVYVLLGLPAGLIGIPWSALRKDFRMMYGWGMWIVALGVKAAGIRVRLEGRENVQPGVQYIFLSNHVSNLDAPVLLPLIPGMTSVFIKRELMKIPLLGTAMRMGKYIPVSRGNSREEAQRSVEVARDVLKSGLHITAFPEGTRSPDGRLLPFKKGAFFLSEAAKASIIPVVITGTERMMPKKTLRITPGEAHVTFLPPVRPQDATSREDLMERVRAAMEAELDRRKLKRE